MSKVTVCCPECHAVSDEGDMEERTTDLFTYLDFECSVCGHQWTKKVNKKKPAEDLTTISLWDH